MNILLISQGSDIANLRYATGFSAPDPVVYVKKGRKGFLLVPALEQGRALKEAKNASVMTPEEIRLKPAQRTLADWCIGLLRHLKIKDVVVSQDFPHGVAEQLKKKRIRITVCEGSLFPRRAQKTDDEIRCIRQSQRSAVRAMKAAMDMIRSSSVNAKGQLIHQGKKLTSEMVREVIEWTLLKQNCGTFSTIVAGGIQATDPHECGSGLLRADEPIVIDIFPYHRGHGYYGDITRTVIKQPPTVSQKKLYTTVLHAQKLALSMVRPGIEASRIHQAVKSYFDEQGYLTSMENGVPQGFFHGTGHGVGLDIHEQPSVSVRPGKLKAGHVITIEPGLYYPKLGGVRIEDTVVVTKDGYDMLAACSKKFHLGN